MKNRIVEMIKQLRDSYEDWTPEYKDCERCLQAIEREFADKKTVKLEDGIMYDREELAAALKVDCSALTDEQVAKRVEETFGVKVLDYGPVFVPRFMIEAKKRK